MFSSRVQGVGSGDIPQGPPIPPWLFQLASSRKLQPVEDGVELVMRLGMVIRSTQYCCETPAGCEQPTY